MIDGNVQRDGWPSGFERLGHETPPGDLRRIARLTDEALRRNASRGPDNDVGNPGVRVVEVGSWSGLATRVLCRPGVTVHAIDTWQGCPGTAGGAAAARIGRTACFRAFCRNIGPRLNVQVFPHVGPSDLYAGVWTWAPDVVWIDADQEFNAFRQTLLEWWRLLPQGGLIAGRPLGVRTVQLAVEELLPGHAAAGDVWWKWKARA